MEHSFPKFTVLEAQRVNNNLRLFVHVDTTKAGGDTWVSDRYTGYLICDKPILSGRRHSTENGWFFSVSKVLDCSGGPYRGRTFDVLDGYWGERAEIVFDEALEWSEHRYEDTDNHTHCFIYWAAISAHENSVFMVSNVDDELCLGCYGSYVISRSLGFVSPNQQS